MPPWPGAHTHTSCRSLHRSLGTLVPGPVAWKRRRKGLMTEEQGQGDIL